MKRPTETLWAACMLPFTLIKHVAVFLFNGQVLNSKTGASLAKTKDYGNYLNTKNSGVMVDGHKLKLSEQHSFMHCLVVGRPGAHKTTGYIIPNLLEKAKDNCSVVVNDPKGEIHHATAGVFKQNGFDVCIIDVENPSQSSRFNPLLEAQNDMELEQLAEVLILASAGASGQSQSKDDFWNKTAVRYVSLFLKVLKNAGQDDPAYFTLHNLLALIQNFGEDGRPLSEFMARYCTYKDDPDNPKLYNEWLGLITGNKDGIQSAILTALTSLRFLTNDNIVKICSRSDISLANIRYKKTAIFLVTPPQHSSYYAAFISIFFKSLYNACMREMPNSRTKPVYVFHDEFATSYIPNFTEIANTIRGYEVSISIVLQSIRQLNARYGKDLAESIMGGFSSYLTYAGSDLITTDYFQNMAGIVRERQKKKLTDTTDTYREYKLLNSDEIRRMGEHQALFVTKNQNPAILNIKPFFVNSTYTTRIKLGQNFEQKQHNSKPKNRQRTDDIRYVKI